MNVVRTLFERVRAKTFESGICAHYSHVSRSWTVIEHKKSGQPRPKVEVRDRNTPVPERGASWENSI